MDNTVFHPLPPMDKELLHYFSVLGRALFTAQQLEMNCRAIVGFVHMRTQTEFLGTSAIDDPKFQEWMENLWKRTFGHHIKELQKIYGFPNEIYSIFEDARVARNTIAHEITMGVLDRIEYSGEPQIDEIKDLVRKIATADKIASSILQAINKEPFPPAVFYLSYEDNIVAWVSEDNFKQSSLRRNGI